MNIPFLYPKSKEKLNAQAPLGLRSHLVASPTLCSSDSEKIESERCEYTVDIDFDTYQSPILLEDLSDEVISTPYYSREDSINSRGFTSTELAIAMALIGLFVGAFLSGQSLVEAVNCVCELSPSFNPRDSCLN